MKRILLIFLSVLFISSCNDMYTPEKPDNTLSGVYEGVYNSVTEGAIYYELNLDTNTLSELSSNEKTFYSIYNCIYGEELRSV